MEANSLRILPAKVHSFKTNIRGLMQSFALKHHPDAVVAVETLLDGTCVTTCDRIPSYSHWIKQDRNYGLGGGVAVCHRDGLQVDSPLVDVPDNIEVFLCIIKEDSRIMLLCATVRGRRSTRVLDRQLL